MKEMHHHRHRSVENAAHTTPCVVKNTNGRGRKKYEIKNNIPICQGAFVAIAAKGVVVLGWILRGKGD